MAHGIRYPLDAGFLLRNKRSLRRTLLQSQGLLEKRIAILGGSTTAEVKDMLELFLLNDGIKPIFYESEYNRYYEDLMFPNPALEQFAPELIYLHTSNVNITRYPSLKDGETEAEALLAAELARFRALWDKAAEQYNCPIIQNNFELPHHRGLGNLDAYDLRGRSRFISALNSHFAEEARRRTSLHLNDINYLSAWFGLERWYDKALWHSYKYAMSSDAVPLLADSAASIIKAILGKTRKCLVLDLDNTLWGGAIGEQGLEGIRIGKETPEAEAYTEFQQYIRRLRERGVILAVCSKNDPANAQLGFAHPDSVLKLEDFSAFQANWEPKPENLRAIAASLNIGMDSLVFVDDSPMERELVQSQAPEVAVPQIGNDVTHYISTLDKIGYFETVSVSSDDLSRSTFYAKNSARLSQQNKFADYAEFLRSLEMKAEIAAFSPLYLDRITQLINKTNQFNVTTRRYTKSELEDILGNEDFVALYGRLTDKFGDNGLVSVMIGEVRSSQIHIDLWLMSCRVLKRGMEDAMFDRFVAAARSRDVTAIHGYFNPTAKNAMVSGLFELMGFTSTGKTDFGGTAWRFNMEGSYTPRNHFIEVTHDPRQTPGQADGNRAGHP